jgi:metal-responsive CopG/Arc/MetJ family transcriptional regulator
MTRKKYINVGLPEELIKFIDEVKESSRKAYKSRAEFVAEACREKIDKEKKVK